MNPSREKRDLIVFGILLLILLLLSPVKQFAQNSYSVNTSNGKTTVKVNNRNNKFVLVYEGEIQVADDDKDIVGISRGGYLEITKSAFGSKRKIKIESVGGQLEKSYYVGSRKQSFSPEGQKWLAEVLPEVLRTTTLAAESRVDRFYRRGGVSAVLEEIEELESDYVGTHYINILLEKDLSSSEMAEVIETAGEVIDSDHYLASILKENQREFLGNDQTTSAYIKAARSIGSDHYLTEVLRRAVDDSDISDSQMGDLLEAAESIGSDHYLSELMKDILDERDLSPQVISQLMVLSDEIASDHYKSTVLRKALDRQDLNEEAYGAFIETLDDIASDHYVKEVIYDLLDEQLDPASLRKVLELVDDNIGSDHYAHEILKKVIREQNLSGQNLDSFIDALDEISSDHYATEVIKSFANGRSISESQMLKILDASESIGSDHYHTTVLVALAPKVKAMSSRVREAYREAAKNINSDTYYGKALKALDR